MKNVHITNIDVSSRQSLTVAAELAQIHDVESSALDTCCDDAFDLVHIFFSFFASEHVLTNTYIEAPNAENGYRWTRYSRHFKQLALFALG